MRTITHAIDTRPYFNRPGIEARRGAAQAISLGLSNNYLPTSHVFAESNQWLIA